MVRVLLVEDNPVTRSGLAEALAAAGHAVRTAADALAALDEMRRRPPEALVLDLMLPGMSGVTLLGAAEARAVPRVVVITASDPEADWGGLPPGVAVLRKPFAPAELLGLLGG